MSTNERPLRVFLQPTGLYSPAMSRIAKALTAHMPLEVMAVRRREDADLEVLYAIGYDTIDHCHNLIKSERKYAIVQCCMETSGGDIRHWLPVWDKAELVWSYYDLLAQLGAALLGSKDGVMHHPSGAEIRLSGESKFYHSPLGVDRAFRREPPSSYARTPRVITSGHVSGRGAEEIGLVWEAARLAGIGIAHIGTGRAEGATNQSGVEFTGEISDRTLANLYETSTHVAGLRYVEGFELGAAEGLCCGAQAIVFAQPAIVRWYGDLGVTLINENGDDRALVSSIANVFDAPNQPAVNRAAARARFDWGVIAPEFWNRLLTNINRENA